VVIACLSGLTACGQKNSYEAAEGALRDWLAAVEDGDARACELETAGYHEKLVGENPDLRGQDPSCEDRVKRMAAMEAAHPAADSEMDVPVWDPSGEAWVEVTDSRTGEVRDYSMVFEDGRWLVAGDES
jgi:hypothetical protein